MSKFNFNVLGVSFVLGTETILVSRARADVVEVSILHEGRPEPLLAELENFVGDPEDLQFVAVAVFHAVVTNSMAEIVTDAGRAVVSEIRNILSKVAQP